MIAFIADMRSALTFLALLSSGCTNNSIPEVPIVEATRNVPPMVVSHPPPAALPEIVPEQPAEAAVWLDGYWTFRADNWVWVRGGWIDGRSSVRLVLSRFWYDKNGVLKFSDRQFQSPEGRAVTTPEILLAAATPPTPLLSEEATVP